MLGIRTATIIAVLQELGDDDFKQFKWHLSEYKHIPYFQLEHSDRVDTSIKIKKTYGTERGLMMTMDLLKEMNMNDVVSRFSSPKAEGYGALADADADAGKTSGRIIKEWQPRQESAFPEQMRPSQFKKHSLMGGGLLIAIMGTILLVVTTVTDHWVESTYEHSWFEHHGLWKTCKDKECFYTFDKWTSHASQLQAAGAFMILACILCSAGIIVGIKSFAPVSPYRRHSCALTTALLFFSAGIILLMVLGIFTAVVPKNFHEFGGQWQWSWSYNLGWAGVAMLSLAGFIYSWIYRKHEKERQKSDGLIKEPFSLHPK